MSDMLDTNTCIKYLRVIAVTRIMQKLSVFIRNYADNASPYIPVIMF